jgi:hypothetical protein
VAEQPAAAEEPAVAEPAAAGPGALEPGPDEAAAEAGAGRAGRPAENTLTLPGLEPGEVPAPRLRLTGEGTLIMSAVPVPGTRDGAAPGGAAGPEAGPEAGGPGPRPRSGYQQANPGEPGSS